MSDRPRAGVAGARRYLCAGANPLLGARRGFYFTISSKLSNLFDLFGTPRQNAQAPDGDAQEVHEKKHDEEEE